MAFSSPPHVVEDVPGVLQLLSDGTVTRFTNYNPLPPPSWPPAEPIEWKDVVYDATNSLKLRVYKPPASAGKLPVLVCFHGGGYILGSFEMPNFHACCLRLAGELPAIVLSADYRLPAAIDDAATVLSWLAAAGDADAWLAESADFRRVFVAGGNIVHNLAVRLGSGHQPGLGPLRVAGHVMLCPLFGGVRRTASEAEFPPGPFLSRAAGVRPGVAPRAAAGVDAGPPGSPALDGVAFPPTLVAAAGKDLLRDRQADYVERLKAMGQPVELVEFDGQHHGFFVVEPYGDAGSNLVRAVKRFVHGNGGRTAASN